MVRCAAIRLLTNTRHPFKEAVIHGAPDEPGVYVLLFGFDILYVGLARETIRGSLLAHAGGELKPSIATHYQCEVVATAAEAAHAEVLQRLPIVPPYNSTATE